jgi:hypothetical protein
MARRHLLTRQHPLTRPVIALARNPQGASQYSRATWPDDKVTLAAIEKGAVNVTSTTSETSFAQQDVLDVVSLLGPQSAFAQITRGAMRLTLGKNTSILVPGITASASGINFVAQGAPIPVRQLVTGGVTLGAKKVALAVALTREVVEASSPNAEVLVTAALNENTSLAMDTILLDATAADAVRPAGLRNGVAATTATVLGVNVTAIDAMTKDLSTLAAAVAAVASSLDNIVFVASPGEAVKIAMRSNQTFPFEVYASSGLASGVVLCLALNAFAVAADVSPKFSLSDQTVVHQEDTSPLAIGTIGTPPTVAAPARSLWQTDCVAIRLVMEMNWILRASGAVAWTQSVNW